MINIEKVKADVAAAKGPGGGVIVVLEAVKAEATLLRMDGGGAGQPVVDKLISAIDAVIAGLQPEATPT